MASDQPIQTNLVALPRYEFVDLLALAQSIGFTGNDANTAAAIAMAESSGDPRAQGDYVSGNPTSLGLWQIHFTAHSEFDPSRLFDPFYNAQAAFSLYSKRGNKFNDWTTFNTNAYVKYLQG